VALLLLKPNPNKADLTGTLAFICRFRRAEKAAHASAVSAL
jgi:hypothetical protein